MSINKQSTTNPQNSFLKDLTKTSIASFGRGFIGGAGAIFGFTVALFIISEFLPNP